MNLQEISYPVFRVSEHEPTKEGTSTFFIYRIDGTLKYRMLDDTSLSYPSLSMRRLKLEEDGYTLV
jgi:hypothetical protein